MSKFKFKALMSCIQKHKGHGHVTRADIERVRYTIRCNQAESVIRIRFDQPVASISRRSEQISRWSSPCCRLSPASSWRTPDRITTAPCAKLAKPAMCCTVAAVCAPSRVFELKPRPAVDQTLCNYLLLGLGCTLHPIVVL